MKIVNLAQGSSDWLVWRNKGIGSSDAPIIAGVSPWTTPEQLFQEKLTGKPSRKMNSAMKRGHDLEPTIRAQYAALFGVQANPACGYDEEYPWLKVSLDGWVPELKLAIEFKAVNKDDHKLALEGKLTRKYEVQCDHHYLVSQATQLHYVSYNPNFAVSERLAVVKYPRQEETISQLFVMEREFWQRLQESRYKLGENSHFTP